MIYIGLDISKCELTYVWEKVDSPLSYNNTILREIIIIDSNYVRPALTIANKISLRYLRDSISSYEDENMKITLNLSRRLLFVHYKALNFYNTLQCSNSEGFMLCSNFIPSSGFDLDASQLYKEKDKCVLVFSSKVLETNLYGENSQFKTEPTVHGVKVNSNDPSGYIFNTNVYFKELGESKLWFFTGSTDKILSIFVGILKPVFKLGKRYELTLGKCIPYFDSVICILETNWRFSHSRLSDNFMQTVMSKLEDDMKRGIELIPDFEGVFNVPVIKSNTCLLNSES
jgi:hypothetical protein